MRRTLAFLVALAMSSWEGTGGCHQSNYIFDILVILFCVLNMTCIYLLFFRFMRGIKDQNCKDDEVLEIRVHYGSKLTFLCPTPVMVPDTVQQDLSKEALYENLWIVYDKWRFDTCTVPNTPKPLLLCDNPKSLKYFTFYFNMYSASKRLDFPHEKYYYFFCKYVFIFFI